MTRQANEKNMRRSRWIVIFGTFTFLMMAACADWRAAQFSSPPNLLLVPALKLPGERASWETITHHIHGWRPRLCGLVHELQNDKELEIDPADDRTLAIPDGSSAHSPKIGMTYEEFVRSYMRNVPRPLWPLDLKKFKEHDVVDPISLKEIEEIEEIGIIDPNDIQTINGPSVSRIVEDCAKPATSPPSQHDSERIIQNLVTGRLSKMINEDHDRLFVSKDEKERYSFVNDRQKKDAYGDRRLVLSTTEHNAASLSLSVRRIQPEDEKEKPPESPKPPSMTKGDATVSDQQSKVTFIAVLHACEQNPSDDSCKNLIKSLHSLISKPDQKIAVPDFDAIQSFELEVSSIINSPDILDRFDYIATYLYIYNYPFPTNGPVNLSEEFWLNFKERQRVKPALEQRLNRDTDLDRSWESLQVRIETVDTTVVLPPAIDIAGVTREGTDKVGITGLKPSATFAGENKLSIEAQGEVSSQTKTTVVEKLLKQLDRRSTWLNPERNLLRITQRGSDSINIGGTFREKIKLNVPASLHTISLMTVKDGLLKIDRQLHLPLYSQVQALGLSIGVVREPFEFKRAAAEKFGLLDSPNSFLVVAESEPMLLKLWNWQRSIGFAKVKDLLIENPQLIPARPSQNNEILRFYYPALNLDDYLAYDENDREQFLTQLKSAILTYAAPAKVQGKTVPQEEAGKKTGAGKTAKQTETKAEPKTGTESRAKKDGKQGDTAENKNILSIDLEPTQSSNGYFLIAAPSDQHSDLTIRGNPLMRVRIGKGTNREKPIMPFECNDIPYLREKLHTKQICVHPTPQTP
jgi:hypothetical protein